MVGRLQFSQGGRGKLWKSGLYGLPVLCSEVDPEGIFAVRRMKRVGKAFARSGTRRVLVPRDSIIWPLWSDYGLAPVDPGPFLRAQAPELALALLKARELAPDRAAVVLRGARADREMARAAAELCKQVRHLIIDVPRGGEELACWLRWEMGVPVLPCREEGHMALSFYPGGRKREEPTVELYGQNPDLAGLVLSAPELEEEDREDLGLLCTLYEGGRLKKEGLKIT